MALNLYLVISKKQVVLWYLYLKNKQGLHNVKCNHNFLSTVEYKLLLFCNYIYFRVADFVVIFRVFYRA